MPECRGRPKANELAFETMTKSKHFDPAEYLDSPEMIAAYLTEAFESGDPVLATLAIDAVARASGSPFTPPASDR